MIPGISGIIGLKKDSLSHIHLLFGPMDIVFADLNDFTKFLAFCRVFAEQEGTKVPEVYLDAFT